MPKICLVVQQFSEEVSGGAEYHALKLTEHLIQKNDVTVLTTTSINYGDWDNHFKVGETHIGAAKVLRFKVESQRRPLKMKAIKALVHIGFKPWFIERLWIKFQGPYCPDLIEFIKHNKDEFNCFIFFSYLYYPTTIGLPLVAEKSILIPTAHLEFPFFLKHSKRLFQSAKHVLTNTNSELTMIRKYYHCKNISTGAWQLESFDSNQSSSDCYEENLLYAGRISKGKRVDKLIGLCSKADLSLSLTGKSDGSINLETLPGSCHYEGFLTREKLVQEISRALCVVNPSQSESMSLITLEALSLGTPVLLNTKCEVFRWYVDNTELAFGYESPEDFHRELKAIKKLREDAVELQKVRTASKKWLKRNFSWGTLDRMLRDPK